MAIKESRKRDGVLIFIAVRLFDELIQLENGQQDSENDD